MSEEIDPDVFTMYQGRKVYFCCESCIKKFEKAPAKYLKKLPDAKPAPVQTPVHTPGHEGHEHDG